MLLNTGSAASSAWGHTGRVCGCPHPAHVPCFASPRRPRGWGSGKCIRRRGGIEPLRVSTPHELKSCRGTSPTHPGSGNPILPGMPPLLLRNGRFPQAGQERMGISAAAGPRSGAAQSCNPRERKTCTRTAPPPMRRLRPGLFRARRAAEHRAGCIFGMGAHRASLRLPTPTARSMLCKPPQAAGLGVGQMHSPARRNRTPACLHAP